MREIKFRAYCKKRKAIFDVTGILFDRSDVVIQVLPDTNALVNIENIELMQYTGLKDENGREIYEGDIVKCFRDSVSVVCMKMDAWGLVTNGIGFKPFYEIYGHCEITGNIYENPELLEGSE